jgi:hypothetical protein
MVRLAFKFTNSGETIYHNQSVNSTITHLIESVVERVRNVLSIDDNSIIEIVEAGQYFNSVSRNPEDAPPIEKSDVTLIDKYGRRILDEKVSFYIRIKTPENQETLATQLTIDIPQEDDNQGYSSEKTVLPRIHRIIQTPESNASTPRL